MQRNACADILNRFIVVTFVLVFLTLKSPQVARCLLKCIIQKNKKKGESVIVYLELESPF